MPSVIEQGTPKTLLDAVQEACRMSGVIAPSTLDNPDRNTTRAILAVKQALNLIWYKNRWDWRWQWATFEMVEGQMWYDLPAGFHAAGATLGINKLASPLTFVAYEMLVEQYPEIRNLPPAFGNADTEQEAVDAGYNSSPDAWTIKGGYLGLWYPPSQSFIDRTSTHVIVGYYAQHVAPTANDDEIGVPVDLYPALENLTLGRFQQYREWPDWKVTYQIGLDQLDQAVARARQVYWETSQLMPRE